MAVKQVLPSCWSGGVGYLEGEYGSFVGMVTRDDLEAVVLVSVHSPQNPFGVRAWQGQSFVNWPVRLLINVI